MQPPEKTISIADKRHISAPKLRVTCNGVKIDNGDIKTVKMANNVMRYSKYFCDLMYRNPFIKSLK